MSSPQIFAASRRRRLAAVLAVVLFATTFGVVNPIGEPEQAAALNVDPISMTGGLVGFEGAQAVLIGEQPTYRFTTSNPAPPGTRDLYNLTYRVVLPVGTSLVSASEPIAAEIADRPAAGQTTVIFDNVADLPLDSLYSLDVVVDTNPDFGGPGVGDDTLPVGTNFDVTAEVFANADPFFVADWDPVTGLVSEDPTGADTDNSYTGTTSATVDADLVAFRVDRTPEGELLRGVHSGGAQVNIEIENNPDYQSGVTSLVDTLSPQWEFIGCTDYYATGDDNSTDVPLNGAAALDEEWVGSGPIMDGPTGGGCSTPISVDTVDAGNLDGTANTVITWDAAALGGGVLSPAATIDVTYQAGVPMRQNTTTFTGATPSAASLGQGRNLDNNSGPSTFEDGFTDNGADAIISVAEPTATSTVTMNGTYTGTTAGALQPVVETFGIEIEDIVISKSSTGSLFHGATVVSTLTVSTGEYRDFQDLQIRDLNPDGLCPQGTFLTDLTAEGVPDWQDDCTAGANSTIGGSGVSYTSVRELGDGRVELIWDHADHAGLTSLPADSSVVLTYTSTVRPNYRESLADDTPVLAGDEVVNRVQVIGPDFSIPETDAAMDLEADGTDDGDTTFEILENSFPTIDKRIAQRTGPVGDGASTTNLTCDVSYDTITWIDGTPSPGALGYGPGDLVCFEITADFPAAMDYDDTLVTDILPAGYDFVPGSAQRIDAGSHPTHPDPDTLSGTVVNVNGQSIEFTLGTSGVVDNVGNQFRWVLAARLGDPGSNEAGDIRSNLQKLYHQNTEGQVFQYRDQTDAEWTEAQLDLVKGVATITTPATAVEINVDQGPDADGSHTGPMASTPIQADAVVEFRIDVWNDGNRDAVDVEVWDLLPVGFTCTEVSGITDSGVCVGDGTVGNPYRITWPSTGIDVSADFGRAAPSIGTPAPLTLRYDLTVFSDVAPDESFTNTAGIRKYESVINGFDDGDGGTDDSRFVYVPASNIDTTASALTPNTDRADDQALLETADVTLAKAQQSGIDESGNGRNASLLTTRDDVTVGEVVQYELTVTIPEGTSVENAVLSDVLPAELVYFEGSALVNGGSVVVGDAVVSVPANAFDSWVVSTPSSGSNGTVSVTQPAGVYTNQEGSGDDTLTFTFWVQVADLVGTDAGDVIVNSATFDFDDSFGGTQPQVVSADRELDVVEPAVTVTKTHTTPAGSTVAPGDTIIWNVRVANGAGASLLHDVVVTDDLPLGVTTVNTSGATTNAGTPETLTWTSTEVPALASIAPGAFVDLTVEVTVDDPATVSLEVRNDADAQGDGLATTDPNGPGRSYTAADFDVLDLPDITAVKDIEPFTGSDQAGAAVGEVLQYATTLTVPDGTIAYDTTVFDVLPAELTFDAFGNTDLGADPIIGANCREYSSGLTTTLLASEIETFTAPGGAADTVAWFLGDVRALGGDCTIQLPYTAHVDGDGDAGEIATNTVRSRWNTVDEVASAAPGALPTDYDSPADAWDEALADVTESVTVVEPQLAIDKDVAFAAGGALASPTCDTTPGNTADGDGSVGNGCDTPVGQVLRYTITVTNSGNGAAHDLSIVDTLPAELTPMDSPAGSAMAGDGTVTGDSGSTLTWTESSRELAGGAVGPLAPGGTLTYDYDVVLPPGSAVTDLDDYANTATVDLYFGLPAAERPINADDPIYGNGAGATRGAVADDVVTVEVHTPDFAIAKTPGTGEDASDARLGVPFTWSITVTNVDGVAHGFGVDVVDVLPAGWTYVPGSTTLTTPYAVVTGAPADPACVADSGACDDPAELNVETLTWSNVVSGAGQPFGVGISPTHEITIEFDATPSAQVLDSTLTTGPTVHRNTATVTGDDASGSSGDADGPYTASDDSDAFVRRTDLRLAKQIEELGPHYFGQDVTYAITVTNDGPDTATGITVEDVLPAQVDLNSVLAGSDGSYVGDTWTIGSLANGATATLRLDVELQAIATITNEAAIETADQWDPDSVPGNSSTPAAEDDTDDAATTTTAGSVGDLIWFDVDGDGTIDPGEPGIPGVDVVVSYDIGNGLVSTTATTDSSGAWGVGSLPVDHPITIDVDELTLPGGMTVSGDPDATVDGTNVITLTDDTPVLDRDFGYTGVNSLGDAVWYDVDGDGATAPAVGDVPLVGVDVDVLWAGFDGTFLTSDDLAIASDTTDASGLWAATLLPDGDYRVTVDDLTLPYGIEVPTHDADGTGTAHIADVTGLGAASTPGVSDTTLDFAYTATVGTIGDLVWLDTDGDGTPSGEVGLAGVDVDLVWTNPDGADVTWSATTAADGGWSFPNLPLGDFTVTVDDMTLPGAVSPTADGDDPVGGGGAGTNHTSAVTLTTGSPTALDQDFGYQGGNAIGDRVWLDVDGDADGLFDGNAIGIGGVTVTLDWTNPNSGLPEQRVATTDVNGLYFFSALPDGVFTVTVDDTTLPPGLSQNHDDDGTGTAHTSQTTLSGAADLDQDFSYVGPGSIGDTVWFDVDGDGVVDVGEPGFSGVTVELTWAGVDGVLGDDPGTVGTDESLDDHTVSTTTDASGGYRFDNLPTTSAAGANFGVTVLDGTLPAGLVPTHDADDPSGGGAPAGTPHSSTARITALAPVVLDQDFGYRGAGSVGDLVWLDLDASGTAIADPAAGGRPAEPGIAGVDLSVVWTNPQGSDLTVTVTTDENGAYLVEHLPHGTVTVTVTATPTGLVQTYGFDGLSAVADVDLDGVNPSSADLDFSYRGTAVLGDRVWYDLDGSGDAEPVGGVLTGGDQPLAGVDVFVDWDGFDGVLGDDPMTVGVDESLDDLRFVATTDATGTWLLTNLPGGDMLVDLDESTTPSGLTEVTWDRDGAAAPDGIAIVTLPDGGDVRDADVSVVGLGSIGDVVWLDVDRDGVRDAAPAGDDEVGLAGVDVTVSWAGPDGPASLTTTTAADGSWSIDRLPFDVPLTVTVDDTDLPGNVAPTHDVDDPAGGTIGTPHTAVVTITSADPNRTDVDFGYAGLGSIGDTIWLDVDGDGASAPVAGDVMLRNVAVVVTWTNPTNGGAPLVLRRVTAVDGTYLADGLPDGDYTVVVDPATLPAGVEPTYDADGALAPALADGASSLTLVDDGLTSGIDEAIRLDQDFAYRGTISVGDLVWYDTDGDGVVDDGTDGELEIGLPGTTVTVVWTDPVTGTTFTWTDVTDADGGYGFDRLPAGDIEVGIDLPAAPVGLADTSDLDGIADGSTELTLTIGGDRLDVDFGVREVTDVRLDKSSTGFFRVGETNSWVVAVTNDGPAVAADVVVTDTLPTGTTYVGVGGPDAASWNCAARPAPDQQTVDCAAAAPMAPGAVSTFHLDVLVDVSAVPSVTNAATVSTTTADLDPTDDVDTDTVEVPLSVLDMSKELAEQLYAGSEALYRLSVRNAGPTATRGTVTVVDQLPADLTYVSSSGDGWACAAEGSTVTCDNDGVIPVGATAVIDVTVRVGAAAGANVANTASVTGGNEVDGVELDETLLPDIIGSIDEGLADVIGVETEGGTVPDGVDDANGNVLARTGMSPVVAILLGLGAVLAGAALVGGTRRRFWWELRWRW